MTEQIKEYKDLPGIVKWWNSKIGIGFLLPVPESNGKDIFIHHSHIVSPDKRKNLIEKQIVTFDLVFAQKGPQAHNIRSK